MFHIDTEMPHDAATIECLLDAVFGADRHAKRSYHFRDGINDVTDLRLVARDNDGKLTGTIRFWPVIIGVHAAPALLLGPLGVDPSRQGEGIGAALIEHGLSTARKRGYTACALVGPLNYYGRFGFAPASTFRISMPGEQQERLLIRELHNDALRGVTGDIGRARTAAAGTGDKSATPPPRAEVAPPTIG